MQNIEQNIRNGLPVSLLIYYALWSVATPFGPTWTSVFLSQTVNELHQDCSKIKAADFPITSSFSTYREAGLFGTRGAIWDGLQIMLCVDCWMSVMNSDFNLRFGTCTKSQISLTVQENYSALNTEHVLWTVPNSPTCPKKPRFPVVLRFSHRKTQWNSPNFSLTKNESVYKEQQVDGRK